MKLPRRRFLQLAAGAAVLPHVARIAVAQSTGRVQERGSPCPA